RWYETCKSERYCKTLHVNPPALVIERVPKSKHLGAGCHHSPPWPAPAARRLFAALSDHCFGRADYVGRSCVELTDELVDLGATHRVDVEEPLLRLGQELRVLHGVVERLAQRRRALGRQVGRRDEWPAHGLAREHQP